MSKIAEMLKTQSQQHCFIKLDTEQTQPLLVPYVHDYSQSPEYLLEYEKEVYSAQGALPAVEVERLIEESSAKFLTAAKETLEASPVIDAEVVEVREVKPRRRASTRPQKPKQNPYDAASSLFTNNQEK